MGLPKDHIQKIEDLLQGPLPKALKNYYEWCGGCKDMNSAQDFLLTLDGRYGHYAFKNFLHPDYFAFYVENQCVYVWGFKKTEGYAKGDPEVYESSDLGKTWSPTGNSLSQFLNSHAYMNFIFSMEYFNEDFVDATEEQVQQLKEQFPIIENVGSPTTTTNNNNNNNIQYLQPYEDTIIMIQEGVDEKYELYYSSRSKQNFKKINRIILRMTGFEFDSESESNSDSD